MCDNALTESEQRRLNEAMNEAAQLFPECSTIEEEEKLYGGKSRTEFILEIAKQHEARITLEAGWIGQRLTWLVMSQAFLFNAFASASAHEGEAIPKALVTLIPLLGFAQSAFAFRSIRAAQNVNRQLLVFREKLDLAIKNLGKQIRAFEYWEVLGEKRYGNRLRNTFYVGRWAQRAIPASLLIAWAFIGLVMWAIAYDWLGFCWSKHP